MHLTKYLHSCIQVEANSTTILFDPGEFSFKEGGVEPERFQNVDAVIITHNHPDHLDIEALQAIVTPRHIPIFTTAEVAEKLKPHQLDATVFEQGERMIGAFRVRAVSTPHQPILADETPTHIAYCLNEQLLNPGDSFGAALDQFHNIPILLLPVLAPFATELEISAFGARLAPRHIIPVHDGQAKPFFLSKRYDTFEKFFKERDITFHRLEDIGAGVTLEG